MLRGLYTSVSSMITLESRQAVINNNIANINTTGYKDEKLITRTFDDVMLSNFENYEDGIAYRQDLGEMSFGTAIDHTKTNFNQGTHFQTDNNTDFALMGDGFFEVRDNNNNSYYTRDGSFVISNEGYLTTSQGHQVMGINPQTGQKEPIFVGNDRISINQANEITVNDRKYKLSIVKFEDNQKLKRASNNLYTGEGATQAQNIQARQGYLEGSNVDFITETVSLMETIKEFEANQKVMQTIDTTLGKIASEIGRI